MGTLTQKMRDSNRGGKEEFKEAYSIPTMHGYDSFFCTEAKVPTYDPMRYPAKFEVGEEMRFGWKAVEDDRPAEPYGTSYWTDGEVKDTTNLEGDNSRVIMDRVIPFVEQAATNEQAFFATVWLHTPHLPVVADVQHRNLFPNLDLHQQIYYGTINAMDEQIGRLWETLEELGIAGQTMIWFCSDNGPERGTPGSAGDFRERKRSLYEGGVRVPAFVVWKDQWKGGERVAFPAVTSDYLPTILEVLDLEYPDDRPIDGESLLGLLEGKSKNRDHPIGFLFGKKISWVDNRYKLISVDEGKNFELYDLLKDGREQQDIIRKKSKIASRMKRELEKWLESVEKSGQGGDYR